MLTLALDTTTPAGSLALRRDGCLIEGRAADATLSPSTRLPGELASLLAAHRLRFSDVDLFAVASGPGSLTGLRVGMATMQGLAFASGRPLVGVSALDALAVAGFEGVAARAEDAVVGALMQAHRGEVFASLHRRAAAGGAADTPGLATIEAASVGRPDEILARWARQASRSDVTIVGDGVAATRDLLVRAFGGGARLLPAPLLAEVVAALAESRAARGLAGPPHAVHPVYVRRPDAEVAREARQRHPDGPVHG